MRQLRRWTAWVLLSGVVLSSLFGTARAEDKAATGEQLLPEEVLVFLSAPSIPVLKERCQGSLFGELLNDPEMKPFLDGVKEKLDELSSEMKDKSGVTLDSLLEIPQGEVTFAVMEMTSRKIGLLLLLDFGDHQSTIDTLLDKLEENLKEHGGEAETADYESVPVTTYTFENEGSNPFNQLSFFTRDNCLVLASSPDITHEVLDRWDGKSEETFAQNDVYKYILDKCASEGRAPVFKWYFNPIGLTQSILGMVQTQIPQAGMAIGFLPILGLNNLKGMGGVGDIDVEDFDSVGRTFLYVDQPTSGLLNMFQFPAADLSPPKWVPADAALYSGMNWDVNAAYSAIETLVDTFQGPGAFARMVDEVAENENGPGIHPKNDLIDQLDGQIHIVMGALEEKEEDEEPTAPKMLFALDVKDAQKMGSVLAKAAKSDSFPGTTREFEGATIYQMEADGENSVAMALAEKHLLIGNDVSLLENALRPRGGGPSLSSSPTFQKLSSKFPEKASMLSYQNGSHQAETMYNALKSGNGIDIPEDLSDLLSKLPEFEVLKKYLRVSGGYTVPDKKGAFSSTFTLKEEK